MLFGNRNSQRVMHFAVSICDSAPGAPIYLATSYAAKAIHVGVPVQRAQRGAGVALAAAGSVAGFV